MVSIRPSKFCGRPEPLDLTNKRLVSSIHTIPLDEFLTRYLSPPKVNGAYLDMRRLPSVWSEAMRHFPENHLFLYSYCLASSHDGIKRLVDIRLNARKVCLQNGNEAGLLWLDMRPKYGMKMAVDNNRRKFPTGDCTVKDWMLDLAKSCCIPSRTLLIIYSSKAMLSSSKDLGKLREILGREIDGWDGWLMGEIQEIARFFNLV
jgi:hypothetical protein